MVCRRLCHSVKKHIDFQPIRREQALADYMSDVALYEKGSVALPDATRSTIALCTSPDGQWLASTHGDHTVKILNASTLKVVSSLDGHPRTPWIVEFHPTNNRIVASGCLGGQVRVWDTMTGRTEFMIRVRAAAITIAARRNS